MITHLMIIVFLVVGFFVGLPITTLKSLLPHFCVSLVHLNNVPIVKHLHLEQLVHFSNVHVLDSTILEVEWVDFPCHHACFHFPC